MSAGLRLDGMAMPQQKAAQLLACLTNTPYRRLTRTDEIADRLVGLIRYPDRCQFTGTVELGKVDCVSPVRLDPLAFAESTMERPRHNRAPCRQVVVECRSRMVRPHNKTVDLVPSKQASPPAPSRQQTYSGSSRARALLPASPLRPMQPLSYPCARQGRHR